MDDNVDLLKQISQLVDRQNQQATQLEIVSQQIVKLNEYLGLLRQDNNEMDKAMRLLLLKMESDSHGE